MDEIRRDLTWAMKKALLEHAQENEALFENDYSTVKDWILNEATYEQLLNLCFNYKADKYYDAALIESVILTERKSGKAYALEMRKIKASKSADFAKKIDAYISGVQDYFKSPQGKQVLKFGGLAILGTVALSTAAYYIYKRYFSAEAKACKNASDFKACVKKYRIDAIKKVIQKLKADKSACSKTKDPQKCNARLAKEISKWQEKLSKAKA